ncbi:MAG: hypothetical protein ABSF41_17465 [Pseudolabrys sp.]
MIALSEDDLAGTIFASLPSTGQQSARGFVKIVPNAPRPDVADNAGMILVLRAALRHGLCRASGVRGALSIWSH